MRRGPSPATLAVLRRLAARYCIDRHEADDVVQDILLSAVEAGRDSGAPQFLSWAHGAIRLRARFLARSIGRRRRRETLHAATRMPPDVEFPRLTDEFVRALPPAQRIVALLANLGLGRREITYLLGISDMAFRQRLAALRKAGERLRHEPVMIREYDDDFSKRGLARRALKASIPKQAGRHFAIRDPDGTPLFFSAPHISPGGGNMERISVEKDNASEV